MPQIAGTAETVTTTDGRRHLYVDGAEFPWYTAGIAYEPSAAGMVGHLVVRIPVDHYSEREQDGLTTPRGLNRTPLTEPPPGTALPATGSDPIGGGAPL